MRRLFRMHIPLRGEDEKYYLVLDDFQYAVDNPIIIETLQYFVENMPPCLSIVITSRRDPGIMEGRLALREDVRLVNSEELLFTLEELAFWLRTFITSPSVMPILKPFSGERMGGLPGCISFAGKGISPMKMWLP